MIAIGSDHGGFELKNYIVKYLLEKGYAVKDYGTYSEDSVDYPDCAKPVCESVISGEAERGILICGIGISIAANKYKGIRAALCSNEYSAAMSRRHNDANILCMGGRVIGRELAYLITDTWLKEKFEGGRHAQRIAKIHAAEE